MILLLAVLVLQATSIVGVVLLWKKIRTNRRELEILIEKRTQKKIDELSVLVQKLESESSTDPLTGLLNRRGGESALLQNLARSRRVKTALSLVLLDLDHFKKINDEHGHGFGDLVLCTVSRTVTTTLRFADFAIRWGGEELLLVLPDTDLEGATLASEKLRLAIEQLVFEGGVKVTASMGVSEVAPSEEFHAALARADLNLYIAKASGRNCVCPSR